ncbi:STAS domain-containing protein [Aquabacterium sp. OR-4]|uniref:STAS domain-containing protein n=1 Tax=Aquabacterium sp. OR-4 TaxID=2978127 RepID=UPI0021B44505|nr:STAS domain-containing protein [Aquabacterium sp. OR-4]MDT7835391.1 STAS domain-containing protein [Aquabacterium sp. OR-4]
MPATLSLSGELTIAQAAAVRDQLQAVLDTAPDGLALDLSALESFDSAGLQLLLATRHSLAERGMPLILGACSAPVRDALRVYGLQALADGSAAAASTPTDRASDA